MKFPAQAAAFMVSGGLGFFSFSAAGMLAFPGAEGYGANAVGGRTGTVYHVTNLNDSGAGSLRTGVSVANRTIVFDVSGTIDLLTDLKITKNNITIAGQTAPGDGITLRRRLTSVQNTHDVIVRFIRCRPGDADCPNFQDDSFHVVNGTNVIVDHVSSSWSIDECLSVTWSTNVTVQWCMITEALRDSCHVKGPHGYGSLLRYGAGGVTYHHDLYEHNSSRNPRPGDNIHLDFVNNVVYDWGGTCGYNADDTADNPNGFTNVLNYAGNYFIAGPSTTGHLTVAFDSGVTNAASCEIYQSGNFIDSNRNTLLDGADTGWSMFSSPYTPRATRFPAPQVNTDSAQTAYERVLAFAGASAARDAVDHRLIGEVRTQTGTNIDSEIQVGGWPTLNSTPAPTDTDQDGIPNYWELALGWNPSVANNNHVNTDGYTDLEWYLNWLAEPHALCGRNGFVDVNLLNVIGVTNNFTFDVTGSSNGVVNLLGDGVTARFVAAANTNGLAGFSFNATNLQTGVGFGPVNVNVLITTTNAPNTPPVLGAVSNRTVIAGATVTFTNTATDADLPPQTLTFSLFNPPSGASIGAGSGIFSWRPLIAQSDTTNTMGVVVADNGSPSLSATQMFSVIVSRPDAPTVGAFSVSDSQFRLSVDGVVGPDYIVQASTNLVDWVDVFSTNPPALPFFWSDQGSSNFDRRFYRILLGP